MPTTRRDLLKGTALAGAGVVSGSLLAGCGSSSTEADGPGAAGSQGAKQSAPVASEAASDSEAYVITALADVPVGGGKICLDPHNTYGQNFVIAQPTAGVVKAFSALCTHERCPVSKIIGKKIHCNCHGSEFSLDDGSVLQGPAAAPLETAEVKIVDGKVLMA